MKSIESTFKSLNYAIQMQLIRANPENATNLLNNNPRVKITLL